MRFLMRHASESGGEGGDGVRMSGGVKGVTGAPTRHLIGKNEKKSGCEKYGNEKPEGNSKAKAHDRVRVKLI
jgi:hypothetical protein